ncbi:MAG: hypothetical protein CMP20_01760 [Rickettsiales bacterium]|nr:hypothetical protein [Rickettsiales bacterium]
MPREVSLQTYTYAILKEVDSDSGMSKSAMAVMNSLLNLLAVRVSTVSVDLARMSGRSTIQARDVKSAILRIFPKELSKHAYSEAEKATQKFQQSHA